MVVSMCSLTDPDVEFIGPGTHYAILLCTTISDETYGIVHSSWPVLSYEVDVVIGCALRVVVQYYTVLY